MKQKKASSTSKKAKGIIRSEMRNYFNAREYGTRSSLDAMKKDADAYNAGGIKRASNYQKGAALVDAGSMACYMNDQKVMLGKIYGKKKVQDWDVEKTHNTYKHLVGREYNQMLIEKEKKKAIKKAMPKKLKSKKPCKRKK